MTTHAIAAILREPAGRFAIERVELDELRRDEVLIRNEASGICHTDLLARERLALPAVLGHEGAGVVEAVGAAVTRVRVGERVALSYPWCGTCPRCDAGEPYLCARHMQLAFGGTRLDGSRPVALGGRAISSAFFQQSSFASRCIALERAVVPVDAPQPSSLLAAIPCGVQTGAGAVLNSLAISARHSLAVFGVGAVGMSAIMAGSLVNAHPLIAIDVLPERLVLARELGASHTLDARTGEIARQIRDIVRDGVDATLETSGNEQALNDAIAGLASGGTCGMVIAPHLGQNYPFSPSEVFTRAARLLGIIQGSAVPRLFLPKLLELHARGRFPFDRMVKYYELDAINDAIADTQAGRTIKPVLIMPPA
ncbi:MAG TPA: NAD(P)-dependent alcohol dehydrogenase [Kofleriaceae bacterium]|jgi:aryl-alcohol dehydrogenase|nr:NAD(P)-dependent alcohol dehydrogenase [Kofleriaceae bacterium]